MSTGEELALEKKEALEKAERVVKDECWVKR